MKHLSNTSQLTEAANKLGLYNLSILSGACKGLIVTESQIDTIEKELSKDQYSQENILELLQSKQDPIWQELLEDTSHKVAQVLLAMLWDPNIGNGLILAPGIDTTDWHNKEKGWIDRTLPTPSYKGGKRTRSIETLFERNDYTYLPPHTDPFELVYDTKTGKPISSNPSDLENDNTALKHLYGRFIFGNKSQPTDFYYTPDDLVLDFHPLQSRQMYEKYGEEVIDISNTVEYIRSEIHKKIDCPGISFYRNLQYCGFSIHAPIVYPILGELPNQDKIYKNQIAHSGYRTRPGEPSGYSKDIYGEDIEVVFGEYGLEGID